MTSICKNSISIKLNPMYNETNNIAKNEKKKADNKLFRRLTNLVWSSLKSNKISVYIKTFTNDDITW